MMYISLRNCIIYFRNEIEILNMYKSEIFDRKENIERLALNTPFHPLIKKRLIDVEDINIISCKYSINEPFCR